MKQKYRSSIINIADAKRHFSHLIGRVAFRGDTITLGRRDRPIAQIVPISQSGRRHLADARGWLENDDPFFQHIDRIVKNRKKHRPRVFKSLRPR